MFLSTQSHERALIKKNKFTSTFEMFSFYSFKMMMIATSFSFWALIFFFLDLSTAQHSTITILFWWYPRVNVANIFERWIYTSKTEIARDWSCLLNKFQHLKMRVGIWWLLKYDKLTVGVDTAFSFCLYTGPPTQTHTHTSFLRSPMNLITCSTRFRYFFLLEFRELSKEKHRACDIYRCITFFS